jgi:hypothetical protein
MSRPSRRRRPRRPRKPLTWRDVAAGVWGILPNLLVYFGGLGLLAVAIGLGPAISAHDQNADLHRHGVRATAEVISVRKQHHHSRHSSWDEWIPTTRQTVGGVSSTTELGRYSSRDEDTFHRGQRMAVLVDPRDLDSVVPASDVARDRTTSQLHKAVGLAIATVLFLGVGVPVLVHRWRADPKRRRRRERAALSFHRGPTSG